MKRTQKFWEHVDALIATWEQWQSDDGIAWEDDPASPAYADLAESARRAVFRFTHGCF